MNKNESARIDRRKFLFGSSAALIDIFVEPHALQALELSPQLSFVEGIAKIREAVATERHESGIFLALDIDSSNGHRWMPVIAGNESSVHGNVHRFGNGAGGILPETGKSFVAVPIHTHNINLPAAQVGRNKEGRLFSIPPSGNDVYIAYDEYGDGWMYGKRTFVVPTVAVADGGGIWTMKKMPGEKRWKLPEIPQLSYAVPEILAWARLHAYEPTSPPEGVQIRIAESLNSPEYKNLQALYRTFGLDLKYVPWSQIKDPTFLR